jgi:hypothetical protein
MFPNPIADPATAATTANLPEKKSRSPVTGLLIDLIFCYNVN